MTLLDKPYLEMLVALYERSSIGPRLESVIDALGPVPLLYPIQIAAAVRDAQLPTDRAPRVLVVQGETMINFDDWRWSMFVHDLLGSRHRCKIDVLSFDCGRRLSGFDTSIKDALPTIRRRVGDVDALERALLSAHPDIVLVSIDLMAPSDGAFLDSPLSSVLTSVKHLYCISTECPRGVVMSAALKHSGVLATPIDVPCLDAHYSSTIEFIDAPLCRIDLSTRLAHDATGPALTVRMLVADCDFSVPNPKHNRAEVQRDANGVERHRMWLTDPVYLDVQAGEFCFGLSRVLERFQAPEELLVRAGRGAAPDSVHIREFLRVWTDAFAIVDAFIRKKKRALDSFDELVGEVLARHGVTVPSVPAAQFNSPVFTAIESNDRRRLLALIRGGANVDAPRLIDGRTPLAFATAKQSVLFDELLDFATNIDSVDADGWTPLAYTIANGRIADARMLIDLGARLSHALPNGVVLSTLLAEVEAIDSDFLVGNDDAAKVGGSQPPTPPSARFGEGIDDVVSGMASHPLSSAIAESTTTTSDHLGLLPVSDLLKQLVSLGDAIPAPVDTTPLQPYREEPAAPAPALEGAARLPTPAAVQDLAAPAAEAPVTAPRADVPRVTVLVTQGQLGDRASPSADVMIEARAVIARWLKHGRARVTVPPAAPDWNVSDAQSSLIAEGNDHLWAMRFEHGSARGVTWRAEVVLADIKGIVHCGVRLTRLGDDPKDPDPVSIPAVVGELSSQLGWRADGLSMVQEARVVREHRAVEGLLALIRSPARALPVVAVGFPRHDWIEHDTLASRLAGVAHVVAVDRARAAWMGTQLGRDLGIPSESVRVYRPGFVDGDDPRHNPLLHLGAGVTPAGLRERIIRAAVRATRWRSSDDDIPTFSAVRLLLAEARSRTPVTVAHEPPAAAADAARAESVVEAVPAPAATVVESAPPLVTESVPVVSTPALAVAEGVEAQLRASLAEVAELSQALTTLRDAMARSRDLIEEERLETRQKLDQLKAYVEDLREESDRQRQANRILRASLDELTLARAHSEGLASPEVVFPDTFDELESWAARYLGDDVILLNRAIKAAKDSPLADPKKAYQALWLLKAYYVPTLYGDRDASAALKAEAMSLGLEISKVGEAATSHRYKSQYSISYRGRTYTMDRHVSGNSSRDPRQGLRVYYAVDEDNGFLIVGHLPGHLDNRMS